MKALALLLVTAFAAFAAHPKQPQLVFWVRSHNGQLYDFRGASNVYSRIIRLEYALYMGIGPKLQGQQRQQAQLNLARLRHQWKRWQPYLVEIDNHHFYKDGRQIHIVGLPNNRKYWGVPLLAIPHGFTNIGGITMPCFVYGQQIEEQVP